MPLRQERPTPTGGPLLLSTIRNPSGVIMITAENLTKTYGPKTAVDGISFTPATDS